MSDTDFAQALADVRERLDDPLGDYDSVGEVALAFMAVELDKMEAAHAELEATIRTLSNGIDWLIDAIAAEEYGNATCAAAGIYAIVGGMPPDKLRDWALAEGELVRQAALAATAEMEDAKDGTPPQTPDL